MNSQLEFVESVLALRPRIAVFDCDGTLWANNSGEDFFYWSMKEPHRLVAERVVRWAKPRYLDYRDGRVDETVMCGEMTSMYAGIAVAEMESAAQEFFTEVVAPNFFPEMQTLTRGLADLGCELWAVSSTNEWVIREGVRDFGIPSMNVLAASVKCRNNVAGGELVRVPSGVGKVVAIQEVIGQPVDAVFGNSIHDAAMLEIARLPYVVNPNPDLETLANRRGWPVFRPKKASGTPLSLRD